jgi:hypothetical protein
MIFCQGTFEIKLNVASHVVGGKAAAHSTPQSF